MDNVAYGTDSTPMDGQKHDNRDSHCKTEERSHPEEAERPRDGSGKCVVCLSVVVVLLLMCVCVSLAVAIWSLVEVKTFPMSDDCSCPEPERLTANLTIAVDSLESELYTLQEAIDSCDSIKSDLEEDINSTQGQLAELKEALNSTGSQVYILRSRLSVLEELISVQFPSCSAINSSFPSSYYWVRAPNGTDVRVYCDMSLSCGGVTGGWTRVAYLQFENGSDPCPEGFRERRDSGIRTCGINSTTAACPSVLFDTHGIPYSRVCGKILGYQYRTTDAFDNHSRSGLLTIDSNYVDGVSLTHGSDPRQHIWTFAAAFDEVRNISVCPCSHRRFNVSRIPVSFVGQDYFCDSGVGADGRYRNDLNFFDDPLWDGAGCGSNSTCCEFNNPPWFHKQLPQSTTDSIEMRVCRDEDQNNEDIRVSHVEIYARA